MALAVESPDSVELDFELTTWNSALKDFKAAHKASDQLRAFLQTQEGGPSDDTAASVRNVCEDLQKTAETKYSSAVGGILNKIDEFMKVGDIAIKSAPESVGLVWMGIRTCLRAVQGDFDTFQMFSSTCADIVGIMISCRTYGKMYGAGKGPQEFQELHIRVVKEVPIIYKSILDFCFAVFKYSNQHRVIRIGKTMLKDVKGQFQDKMSAIKRSEADMRAYAATASQQQSLHNQEEILAALKKKTPYEKAKEEFEAIQKSLNPAPDQNRIWRDNVDQRREPGTCRWIFEMQEYKEWRDTESTSMLWVSGVAGYGKSILMSSVIENLLSSEQFENSDYLVHFFFCKTGEDATQSSTRLLNTVLHRLYSAFRPLEDLLAKANLAMTGDKDKKDKSADKTADKLSDMKSLAEFKLMYDALLQILGQKVFLIIDAIDECIDRQDKRLLQTLRSVGSTTGANVKIMFCSRPEPDISNELRNMPVIKCEGHNENDIQKAVETGMNKFPRWTASEKSFACREISLKASGQFKYVNIALNFLRKPMVRPYENTIRNLPDGLTGSYVTSWDQTDPDYIELLKTALTWTVLAHGPVTVSEIMDAYTGTYRPEIDLQGDQEDIFVNDEDVNLHDSQIRIAGGNFLEVSGMHIVSIRHATVKEFFLDESMDHQADAATDPKDCKLANGPVNLQTISTLQKSRWHVSAKHGHLQLVKTFLQTVSSPAYIEKYLKNELSTWRFGSFESSPASSRQSSPEPGVNEDLPNPDSPDLMAAIGSENNLDLVPLTQHAVHKDISVDVDEESQDNERRINQCPDVPINNDADHVSIEMDSSRYLSHPPSVKNGSSDEWSDRTSHVPRTLHTDSDFSYRPHRSWRSYWTDNRYELCHWQFHLSSALSLWTQGERQSHPAWIELRDIFIQLMLEEPRILQSLMQIASMQSESPLELLRDFSSYGPLHIASAVGFVELAEELLRRGADIERRATKVSKYRRFRSNGPTPLGIAAQTRDLEMMELLLKHRADPNALPLSNDNVAWNMGRTPFYIALDNCPSKACVDLFLRYGADPMLKDCFDGTALHYFSNTGTDVEAFKTLVAVGADVNSPDNRGELPLHQLVRRTDTPVELLMAYIEAGADVNWDDNQSVRPLNQAVYAENDQILTILLEHGADLHDKDNDGRTALHTAAVQSQPSIIKILLAHGAEVNLSDDRGETPLFLACVESHEDTVQCLVDAMEDLPCEEFNRPNDRGITPFMKAVESRRCNSLVKILLRKSGMSSMIDNRFPALVRTRYRLYNSRSPLEAAIRTGDYKLLETLLAAGANPSIDDPGGLTTLQLCIRTFAKSDRKGCEDILMWSIDRYRAEATLSPQLLFTAAVKGSVCVLGKLLEIGVDINVTDEFGWTPLMLAQQHNQAAAIALLSRRDLNNSTRPTEWKSSTPRVEVSTDGLSLSHIVPDTTGRRSYLTSVMSNRPLALQENKFYFEVETVDLGPNEVRDKQVRVGMTTYPTKLLNTLPGGLTSAATSSSWAFCADHCVAQSSKGEINARFFRSDFFNKVGAVIGCAVDLQRGEIYFTLNGEEFKKAFEGVAGRLYPVVGLDGPVKARANFGTDIEAEPFRWKGYKDWIENDVLPLPPSPAPSRRRVTSRGGKYSLRDDNEDVVYIR